MWTAEILKTVKSLYLSNWFLIIPMHMMNRELIPGR